jgi:hypothetical protein
MQNTLMTRRQGHYGIRPSLPGGLKSDNPIGKPPISAKGMLGMITLGLVTEAWGGFAA